MHKPRITCLLQPGGLPAISRGLSEATPPEHKDIEHRPRRGRSNPTPPKVLYWFPSYISRRYTQARASRISRHFGMDAEIQAMDGNQSDVQVLNSDDLPARS